VNRLDLFIQRQVSQCGWMTRRCFQSGEEIFSLSCHFLMSTGAHSAFYRVDDGNEAAMVVRLTAHLHQVPVL
jgi:hypothetical protein